MKKKTQKEINEKERIDEFNDGRLNCDGKWRKAIDRRIKELEEQVGIPELRRLKSKVSYKWSNEESKW